MVCCSKSLAGVDLNGIEAPVRFLSVVAAMHEETACLYRWECGLGFGNPILVFNLGECQC